MSVVLHLSDTHFGTEQPQVVEALVALAAQQRPDVVILSGDITQRARPAQFRAARDFVDRLGAPVLAIPGNHDIALFDWWSRLFGPYARFASAFGTELEPVHATADLLIVGVNTTRVWRHKHGEVSASQIARVATVLAAASTQQLRIVVVHQPAAVPEAGERHNLLRGHADATRAWAAAGADLVLGGHIHLPFTLLLHGVARRLWVVQAGTAVSRRTRAGVPNSVNLLRWGGHCLIERWDFDHHTQAFSPALVTVVQPDRATPADLARAGTTLDTPCTPHANGWR
jgi:3',5'-cyclic AMP phosphodiesterase CpdA